MNMKELKTINAAYRIGVFSSSPSGDSAGTLASTASGILRGNGRCVVYLGQKRATGTLNQRRCQMDFARHWLMMDSF